MLRERARRLACVEIDGRLVSAVASRVAGSSVRVIHADGTRLPFEDGSFTGAVSLTMLHHVPGAEPQDASSVPASRTPR